MFKAKEKNIEAIKNILIVVLFVMTVLLLCFFWKNDSFEMFKLPIDIIFNEPEADIPQVREVLQPEQIVVSFGTTGSYTVLYSSKKQLWHQAQQSLRQLGNSESLLLEEITPQQYRQVTELRSIQFQFPYDIPFSDFISRNEMKRTQAMDAVSGLGTLTYSEGSKESIFIYQNKGNKYYRIISSEESFSDFASMIDRIEESPYVTYYPSSNYFGVETEQMAMIPLSLQSSLSSIPFQHESTGDSKEKLTELAESFFGESFDFIRRMTDNKGRLIFMYGYGQKVFTVNPDGTFEYKEELGDGSSLQLDFYESLELAMRFAGSHGGWDSFKEPLSPYLESVKVLDKDRKRGYRFIFGVEVNGYQVQYENGNAIEIDIYGSQIVRYKRNVIQIDNDAAVASVGGEVKETFPAVNVPAVNFEYISNLYQSASDVSYNGEESFESIAEKIREIRVGYVRLSAEGTQITPVWILKMPGLNLYFDLYEAAPLGYTYEDQ